VDLTAVVMDELTARLRDAATAFEDFQSQPDGQGHLNRLLRQLTDTAVRTVPAAAAASVTMLRDEGLSAWTAAATDDAVAAFDLAQYAAGEGPCLDAARERHSVRAGLEKLRARWPAFAEAAERAGMRSCLAAPLLLGDGPLLGSLNLYGQAADGFSPLDEAMTALLASAASAVIVNVRRYLLTDERVEEISVALTSRAEIDQAKGVLMARHLIAAEKAFEMMVLQSQRSNTKLRDVAREVLNTVARHPRPPGEIDQ
jgi:GAF domain-containing protein